MAPLQGGCAESGEGRGKEWNGRVGGGCPWGSCLCARSPPVQLGAEETRELGIAATPAELAEPQVHLPPHVPQQLLLTQWYFQRPLDSVKREGGATQLRPVFVLEVPVSGTLAAPASLQCTVRTQMSIL
jgi:hypothetical protein